MKTESSNTKQRIHSINKRSFCLWICVAFLPLAQFRLFGADAATYIQDLIQSNDGIEITMTSMNVNGVTSYARFIDVKKINIVAKKGAPYITPRLSATGAQYFNDRVKGEQPFSAANTDKVEIDVKATEVVLTLLDWNKGKIRFTPSLVSNLLYGWSEDGKTYFILHCKRNAPVL